MRSIARVMAVVLALVPVAGQAFPVRFEVEPPVVRAAPGETFEVRVVVDPYGSPITGAQVDIAFDRSIINVNGVGEGDLLRQGGGTTYFNGASIDNALGTVTNIFGVITFGSPATTRGVFLTLSATVVSSAGVSPIDLFDAGVTSAFPNNLALSLGNGSVVVDSAPVLGPIGDKTVYEADALSFTISATGEAGEVLAYSASNLPAGATFDPATHLFQWTPGYDQAGLYPNVRFEVTDGTKVAAEEITITVNDVSPCAGRVCAPEDECNYAGVCDPATGTCSDQRRPNGTPCRRGTCVDGVCEAQGCMCGGGGAGALPFVLLGLLARRRRAV